MRWCVVARGVIVIALASCTATTDERVLGRDATVDADLAAEGRLRFAVAATAGDAIELVVEQRGVDATVDVVGPRGAAVVTALDLAGGVAGAERYGFVAADSGRYAIEISAAYPTIARGRIRLSLRGPSRPDDAALRRAAAHATADELATLLGWKPAAGVEATGEQREAALVRCESLRAAWVALADRRGEAEALELCASAARQLGRGEAAETLADRAAAIYRALGRPAEEAHCLLERGSGRYIRGDVPDARRSWERALALAQQAGDPGAAVTALTGLGIASLSVEDYRRAREELTLARDRAVAIGRDDSVALAEDNLGRSYARLGHAELALDHYARALAVWERDGKTHHAGRTRHAVALVHRDLLDDPAAARAELDRALALLRRSGNRDGESLALIDLGLADRSAGDLARAAARLDEAVTIARAIDSPHILARARAAQGLIALDRGAIDDALTAYDEARRGYAGIGGHGAEALARVGLARARVARGDLDGARHEVAAALTIFDGLRKRVPSPELRATYFASVRSAYDLDIDLRLQLDRGRGGPHAVAAFEASERARARSLLEVLHTGGGDPAAVAPEARAALDGAANEVAQREAAHRELLGGDPTAARVRASENAVATALVRQREALDALRARSPGAADLVAPPALTLDAVQALLDDDTVLLEYVVAEPRSYVFAVRRRQLTVRTLPGRGAIDAAARALHDHVTARNARIADEDAPHRAQRVARADAAVPAAAAHLADLVVAPVADAIAGARRVLVAPDGALAYTPFALLPDPVRAPAMLLDDHDVVMLPSASVLAALRARHTGPRAGAAPRIAIVADPVYGAGDPRIADVVTRAALPAHELPRLPFAADEAAAIAALVPAERVRLVTGLDARRDLLTGDALRDHGIVHIAAHGLLNTRHPDLSGLMLSTVDARGAEQDGLVRLHDVYRLSLRAELVTLSGCDTAMGREIRGEGMIGLARGFLHAGARRVVASLWQVHDRATAELMRRFYQGMLERGLAPAAALRDAQREMRDRTAYAAPYFWAAFVLQGDDRP
jgi:CHAT domain-containing protein